MTLYLSKRNNPSSFRALTGLSLEQFDYLLPLWTTQWIETMEYQTVTGKYRWNRRHSSYKNSRLPTPADKLFFIMMFIKQAPTQEMHGTVFGMAQPTVNTWIHVLLPILYATCAHNTFLPARTPDEFRMYLSALPHDADSLPESLFFYHDAVERPIERPIDADEQRFLYSGKRKRHTVKNTAITNASNRVVYLSPTHQGSTHDKRVADEEQYTIGMPFPEHSRVYEDRGFIGLLWNQITIERPHKKLPNQQLTREQKDENRLHAQKRVVIEHVFGRIKRFRIVKDVLRLKVHMVDDMIMQICCGIHNCVIHMKSV